MSMSSIVNNIDPNAVIALVTLVGGWLWSKRKGEKTTSARELLEDVVRQVINAADVDPDNVKTRAEAKIRGALAKINVKGTTAELLVHEFVEYAAAELGERWAKFTRDMDALKAANAEMVKAGLA